MPTKTRESDAARREAFHAKLMASCANERELGIELFSKLCKQSIWTIESWLKPGKAPPPEYMMDLIEYRFADPAYKALIKSTLKAAMLRATKRAEANRMPKPRRQNVQNVKATRRRRAA